MRGDSLKRLLFNNKGKESAVRGDWIVIPPTGIMKPNNCGHKVQAVSDPTIKTYVVKRDLKPSPSNVIRFYLDQLK